MFLEYSHNILKQTCIRGRMMSSFTQLSQAALLLRSLDETAKVTSTELSVITPAISKFLELNDKLNNKLVDNISGYKSVIDDSNALITDVISFNVDGSRGKFATNLKAFAMNGTWTVYGQQYISKKVPFVTQEGPLQKIVWTRNKIQSMLDETYNEVECTIIFNQEMDDIVKGFERAYLADINEYNDQFADEVDFDFVWGAARMSLKNLNENPYRYHDVWVHFFSDKDKVSIPKLVENISEALVYYRRNVTIKNRLASNNRMTNEVIEESSTVRETSIGFIRREGELKLLKLAGEQSGDKGLLEKCEEADKLNVDAFIKVATVKPITGDMVVFTYKTDSDIEQEIIADQLDSSDSDTASISSTPLPKRGGSVRMATRAMGNALSDIADKVICDAQSPWTSKKRRIDEVPEEPLVL